MWSWEWTPRGTELAWELLNLNSAPGLEPRLLDLSSAFILLDVSCCFQGVSRTSPSAPSAGASVRRTQVARWHLRRNPNFHSHLHCAHDSSLVPKKAPAHLRLLLTPALISWLCGFRSEGRPDGDLGNLSAFTEEHTRAADLRWTRKGLRTREDGEAGEALGDEAEEDGHEDVKDDAEPASLSKPRTRSLGQSGNQMVCDHLAKIFTIT